MLVSGVTKHARFRPRPHTFQYPVAYLLLDSLHPNLPATKNVLGKGIYDWFFAVRPNDFLDITSTGTGLNGGDINESTGAILDRVRKLFDANQSGQVDRVLTISMPRVRALWFRPAFNPLTVHYAYSHNPDGAYGNDEEWKWIGTVLEVSNTFGERHLDILPADLDSSTSSDIKKLPAEATRKGYDAAFWIRRRFHVSPFNDLSGWYEVHLSDPLTRLDYCATGAASIEVVITMWVPAEGKSVVDAGTEWTRDHAGLEKKFMASLSLSPHHDEDDVTNVPAFMRAITPLVWLALVLIQTSVGILLTFPRILYQAYLLAYSRKLQLPVYPKPDPPESANTIIRLNDESKVGWVEHRTKHWVMRVLRDKFQDGGIGLVIDEAEQSSQDGSGLTQPTIKIGDIGSKMMVRLKLRNWDFWVWMALWGLRDGGSSMTLVVKCLESEGALGFENERDRTLFLDVLSKHVGQKRVAIGGSVSSSITALVAVMIQWVRVLWWYLLTGSVSLNNKVTSLDEGAIEDGWLSAMVCVVVSGVVWLSQYALFDTLTPWANGYGPAPWTRFRRYVRSQIPNKKV